MKTNRFFTKLLAVMMTLALCSGMVLPALAATVEAKNICGKEEHTHTEDCYNGEATEAEPVLVCGKTEETVESGHAHTDACFTATTEPNCGESTESTESHTDKCYESYTILTCGKDAHSHDGECQRSCDLAEHSHDGDCQRTCDLSEHSHDGSCEEGCSISEHTHDDSCQSTCSLSEHTHDSECQRSCSAEEHTHDANCYETVSDGKLICTDPDHSLPAHKHDAGCYQEQTCTLDESDVVYHEHTDACYEIQDTQAPICGKEEHTHDKTCFSGMDKETGLPLVDALAEALKNAEDKDITLILNGQVLTYDKNNTTAIIVNDGRTLTIDDAIGEGTICATGSGLRLIKVENGGTVNLKGGTLTGAAGVGGGAIYVGDKGTLNMSGGSISGNTSINGANGGSNGGAVLVEKNGSFTMSGGTISDNEATKNGGGVAVNDGGTFTMTGGTIDGNTVSGEGNGGGVYVGKDGTFNMTGGTISNNTTDTTHYDDKNAPMGQGGGVAVGAGGKFNMSGGTIDHNTAGEGGGVFVDRGPIDGKGPYASGSFTMNGGTIDSNTAKLGEGGGVYIKGEGEITKGSITNNVTETYKDLGGGGIYIESDGTLTLKNAIIIGNTANGLGGGIAACVHGKTYVYALNGAIITGNNALGQGHTAGYGSDGKYNGSFTDGYTYWATADEIIKNSAQDIFAAGDAFKVNGQGTAGIVVSNNLPGDKGSANWSGYTFSYVTNEKGEYIKDDNDNYIFELTEVTKDNNGVVYGNRLVFLTSDPSDKAVQEAIAAMKECVFISGNLSANSHGGGIANNGVLTIGESEDGDKITGNDSYVPDVELEKKLDSDDNNVTLANKKFTFVMKDKDGEDGNIIGTVTNDKNGNATFNFPEGFFNGVEFKDGEFEKEFVFFVSEYNDGQENVTYDGTTYKVVITLTRTTEEVKLGHETVTLETVSIGEPKILVKIVHEDGTEEYKEAENGIVFNNTYKTPDDDDDDEPNGNEDPTPTPTPTPELPEEPVEPDEPVEDLPEPEVPLDELPDESLEELPEPEVPLNDVPYEEEEILDEEVPLADVPQTGDISLLWYVGSLLSTCGLAALAMGKKRS